MNDTSRDPRDRSERPFGWFSSGRQLYAGKTLRESPEHVRAIMQEYRKLQREQRKLNNEVGVHRDELDIRRSVGMDCNSTRQKRIRETGNKFYKLTFEERREIAQRNGCQFVGGHILMPDREAYVRTPDGREWTVQIEALTKNYSLRQVMRSVACGARTNMAGSALKSQWKSGHGGMKVMLKHSRGGGKRPWHKPSIMGELLRSIR